MFLGIDSLKDYSLKIFAVKVYWRRAEDSNPTGDYPAHCFQDKSAALAVRSPERAVTNIKYLLPQKEYEYQLITNGGECKIRTCERKLR